MEDKGTNMEQTKSVASHRDSPCSNYDNYFVHLKFGPFKNSEPSQVQSMLRKIEDHQGRVSRTIDDIINQDRNAIDM